MKVTILAKNICNACYMYTRINHNGKRICLSLFMAQNSLKIIAPLSSPIKIRIYRDSSRIKISNYFKFSIDVSKTT